MLKRIVALLFALADLADRAKLAPHPVRSHALGFLRQAEAVAHAFVIGVARDLNEKTPPRADVDGDDPDDATRLALRLRVLALALASLSTQADCAARPGRIVKAASIDVSRKPAQATGRRTQIAPDTS